MDRLETGNACLGDSRQLRQRRRTLRGSQREAAEPAALHVGQGSNVAAQKELRLTSDQLNEGRAGAFVWDVRHIDPSHQLEQLDVQMNEPSVTGRGIVELAWVRFRMSDQILDR